MQTNFSLVHYLELNPNLIEHFLEIKKRHRKTLINSREAPSSNLIEDNCCHDMFTNH